MKTSTGIWAITYDTENRPTDFTSMAADNTITAVHCEYDSMGRRAIKRVTVNGNVTLHQRYIYRGYLQIACIDLTRSHHPALWYITWDPTQNIATRPLALQKDGTWYTNGWDLTKNICEVYSSSGYIRSSYTYSPYGQVSARGAIEQPIQWSSEYNDTELGLIYYNYRHYNSVDGRWIGRDKIVEMEHQNLHVYPYVANSPLSLFDILGLDAFPCNRENKGRYKELKIKIYLQTFDEDIEIIDTENANIGKIIKDEIIDRAKSKVHGDMRDRLKQKIESNEMFRSMKKELEDVANGIKKHPVFKFLKNGISTTSGTILGVKIDVEAKFCICRNGEHEFVNCHGTAETFPIRIAIASLNRDSVKRLKRLPEYFAQASYSAVEELYKVKTYHEKK